MKTEDKIREVLNKIRPYLINDGGDVELVKFENGIAYVKMMGACADCMMLDYTLKDGIEQAIKEEVPEVKEVVNLI